MNSGTEVDNRIEEATYSNITASTQCIIQRGSYNAIIGSQIVGIGGGTSNIILGSHFISYDNDPPIVISGGDYNGVICTPYLGNTLTTTPIAGGCKGCVIIGCQPEASSSLEIANSEYSTIISSTGCQIAKSHKSTIIGCTYCNILDQKNSTTGHVRNILLGCHSSNINISNYANAGTISLISCYNTEINPTMPYSLGVGLGCYEGICLD